MPLHLIQRLTRLCIRAVLGHAFAHRVWIAVLGGRVVATFGKPGLVKLEQEINAHQLPVEKHVAIGGYMRLLAVGGFVVVAGAAVYFFASPRPADVYAMPVADAYSKLSTVEIVPSGTGTFGRLDTTVSGNGSNKVIWHATGSHATRRCELSLAPTEDAQTHVTVDCSGGSASDGAAAGMVHNMSRNRVIEMVDATLTDRPFDPKRAEGSTAARWPGDGVDGSLGNAVGGAIKMNADMHKLHREIEVSENERKEREAEQREQAAYDEWAE